MAWIFHCALWVTLISTSAYHQKYNFGFPSYFYDYPNFFYDNSGYRTPAPYRRIDHGYHQTYQSHERMVERSAETQYETSRERSNVRVNERPAQRMNERSIQVHTNIQRVQEEERRRYVPRVGDATPRVENGSYKIVNNHLKTHTNIHNRQGQPEEDRLSQNDNVVFPGPDSRSSPSYKPEIPEECLKTGICENVPNYPEEHVASIIEKLGDVTDRFKIDELDTPEIAQRIGPIEEMELCEFRVMIATPRAAPDKNGTWRYIVNPKDKPVQGFHVEVCKADKSPCSKLAYFYTGYEASCKQKYVLRHMTALNENGQMVQDLFKLPSCCTCIVRQIE